MNLGRCRAPSLLFGVPGRCDVAVLPVRYPRRGWGEARASRGDLRSVPKEPLGPALLATPAECGNVDPFRQGRCVADAADRPEMARLNFRFWDSRVQLKPYGR